MDPIIAYLKDGELAKEKTEARILQLKAARYVLYDDKLYRRGCSMPLLKCVLTMEAKNIIWEIHNGTCGNHAGGAIPSIQSPEVVLLLANHKGGLHGVCPEMRQVPMILTSIESSSKRAHFND